MSNFVERIREYLTLPVEGAGYELVDIEYKKEGQGWILRLYIDWANGIHLEDCIKINDICEPLMDASEIIPGAYTLEVSSPGIFRPLTKPQHFEKAVGKIIRVRLFQKFEEKKQAKGELIETTQEGISLWLEDEEKKLFIPYKLIAKSNLEPQLDF